MARKVIDCREMPESTCSLTIAGEEEEVIRAGTEHAMSVHGEKEGPELREMIRNGMKDEMPMESTDRMRMEQPSQGPARVT
jgi:hypothetical protein